MCWFCISTGETHSSKLAILSLILNRMKKWLIFDIMVYQGLLKYQISFLLYKVSELSKFQMCWFCISTGETHSSKLAILSLILNRMKKWLIFDIMVYQGLLKYQISFLLYKVIELWKFQMCWFSISTCVIHSSKLTILSLILNRMKRWLIFDIMVYQGLLKYQISFLLYKVSELWKFQMCWFCISTGETHSSKLAILSLILNRMKNDSYLT